MGNNLITITADGIVMYCFFILNIIFQIKVFVTSLKMFENNKKIGQSDRNGFKSFLTLNILYYIYDP